MEWFIYSISSVLMFSVMAALYKLPAHKNQSRLAATVWMMGFIFLFAFLFFNKQIPNIDNKVIFFGFIWGTAFSFLTAIQMYLLKKVEVNTLFPINTTISLIISICFGLLVFHDHISILQGLGIVVAILAVYLFLFDKKKIKFPKDVVLISLVMFALSVFTKVVQKTAVDHVIDIRPLIMSQFFFATIVLLMFFSVYNRKYFKTKLFSGSAKSGLFIAIPSFIGNWAIMTALSKGPFTLITALHSLYIFGGSILGYFFFKENLTKKKLALLGLAIIAIILIRVG